MAISRINKINLSGEQKTALILSVFCLFLAPVCAQDNTEAPVPSPAVTNSSQANFYYGSSNYGAQSNYAPPQYSRVIPNYNEATASAGLVIPISLDTSISTQAASSGDYIQAHISQNVSLTGSGYLPAGTVVTGTVEAAKKGRWAERSGLLTIAFNQLRLPNGTLIPISAHLVGNIGKYKNKNDTVRGEGMGTKLWNAGLRGGLGAGLGAALGTAVGGIAGGGFGVGAGAWSGAAIGGGVGLLDSLVLRRGRDVIIHGGTEMQLQLDESVVIPVPAPESMAPAAQPNTGVF